MNLNDNERKVLKALSDAYSAYEEFCYLNFAGISKRCGDLDRKVVRRAARSLTRKGLAEYGRGLWTDDGELAGSGYCCTKAGSLALPPQELRPSPSAPDASTPDR